MTGIRRFLAVAFTALGLVGGILAATGSAQAAYYRGQREYGSSGYREDYGSRHPARHHEWRDYRHEGYWRR